MKALDEDLVLHGDGSFRPRGGGFGRSGSTRVLLDNSISSQCALSTKYERLSPADESPPTRQQRTAGVWRLLSLVPLAGKAVDVSLGAGGDDRGSGEQGFAPTTPTEKNSEQQVSTAAPSSSSNKEEGRNTTTTTKKKKKRSSWLPDPEKRWPIQGW